VSGGADSVALAWILHTISAADAEGVAVTGLLHMNHGLRGDESARDEAFCRALAARLDQPIEVGQADVAALARARGQSIEAAARDTRYAFFLEAARRLGAAHVATGHTIDDQAETVLLRLLRGSGGRGVTGIRVRRGPFVRPLLECRRAELREYLAWRGEVFCEDSSNEDQGIARNRVRHQLLPQIALVAPGGVRALARFAALAGDDEAYLTDRAIEAASFVVLSNEGGVTVDAASSRRGGGVQPLKLDVVALKKLPSAVARRLVRRVAEQVAPGTGFAMRHFDAVLRLAATDKPAGHLDLPGLTIEREGQTMTVGPSARGWLSPGAPTGRVAPFERPLPVPGQVKVDEVGVTITAAAASVAPDELASGGANVAVVQAAAVALPLRVRNRRNGDRFRPLGAPGRRKLQDVLVDRKVPQRMRDRVPLVVDAAGRIVWVVGVTIADECRVTTPGAGVVVLKVQPQEGP
jgi:tRNA(Ile)-lysidine synthase